ncbi:hypothetical protein [uncultured Methanobrevibacter sp.]|nr:hypothetical protein [uncultured Methanobrevibacter sp.]
MAIIYAIKKFHNLKVSKSLHRPEHPMQANPVTQVNISNLWLNKL